MNKVFPLSDAAAIASLMPVPQIERTIYNEAVVDIHTHILPDADDGARSWDMAKEMCQVAARDGIAHIVATPHADEEYVFDRAKHQRSLDQLQSEVGEGVKLSLGCDFHFSFENIQAAVKDPSAFAIADTQYLLVELSDFAVSGAITEAIRRLREVGLKPIITHPERNPILQRSPDSILRLAEQGCIIQVTASAFTGFWGEPIQKIAEWLLRKKTIHVVASDAHDVKNRPPVLSPARRRIAELAGEAISTMLVADNPAAIVAGRDLTYPS
jgi:protein-tyrosine phosphatase